MSGIHPRILDIALGYDDSHQSTTKSRFEYLFSWNRTAAKCQNSKVDLVLQLRGPQIVLRPCGNEAEWIVSKIVANTLERMTTLEKK